MIVVVVLVIMLVLGHETDPSRQSLRCGPVILDGHNDLALRVFLGQEPRHIDLATAVEQGFAGGFFALSSPQASADFPSGGAVRASARRANRPRRGVGCGRRDARRARGARPDGGDARLGDPAGTGERDRALRGRRADRPRSLRPRRLGRARAPLGRDHLVAGECVRRRSAVPLPLDARHRAGADRGRARPPARLQLPRAPRRCLAPERGGVLGRRPCLAGADRRDAFERACSLAVVAEPHRPATRRDRGVGGRRRRQLRGHVPHRGWGLGRRGSRRS